MSKKQRHVLIAEDNVFLGKMMKKVLGLRGIRVSSACDGKEAIRIIDADPPNLLLLDLLLPSIDGYGILQHRKEKKLTFPAIVCSNLSDKANRDKCKTFGVSAYIVKSDMDDEQLWPILEKYLQ